MIRRTLSVLAVGAALCACTRHAEKEGDDEKAGGPKKVRCAPIVARPIVDSVEVRGTVAPLPDRDAQVAPQVAGRVMRVLVREGDRVAPNQELARIDEATLQDQAQEAAAQLAKARAEGRLAETTEARVRRIFDRGIAARQELDDAEARLATARAGEAEARAAELIARRQLARAAVRSPLAGVVLKVLRRPGELVDGTPATPVVEVGDPSRLELVATVTAAEIVRLSPGAAATLDVSALPGKRYDGKVVAVAPAVDRTTGLGTVRIAIDLSPGALPVGVAGIARVAAGGAREALTVPKAALRAPAGHEAEVVLCGTDGKAHVQRVTTSPLADGVTIAPVEDDRATDAGVRLAGGAVVVEPVLGVADGDTIERGP